MKVLIYLIMIISFSTAQISNTDSSFLKYNQDLVNKYSSENSINSLSNDVNKNLSTYLEKELNNNSLTQSNYFKGISSSYESALKNNALKELYSNANSLMKQYSSYKDTIQKKVSNVENLIKNTSLSNLSNVFKNKDFSFYDDENNKISIFDSKNFSQESENTNSASNDMIGSFYCLCSSEDTNAFKTVDNYIYKDNLTAIYKALGKYKSSLEENIKVTDEQNDELDNKIKSIKINLSRLTVYYKLLNKSNNEETFIK